MNRTPRITLTAEQSTALRVLAARRNQDLKDLLALMVDRALEHWDPVKERAEEYRRRASNPFRRDEDDVWLARELEELRALGQDPNYVPVPRREFKREVR